MGILNGCNVNTPAFWRKWVDGGGNINTYMTSVLPTYGVVGTLALTHQMSMSLEPPASFAPNSVWYILYAVLSHLATLMSFALIILPMVLHTQYNCCINKITQINFVCKFGHVIPLLFTMLSIMGICWFSTLLIVLSTKYSLEVFIIITVETGIVSIIGYILFPIWIQCWNSNLNYGLELELSENIIHENFK